MLHKTKTWRLQSIVANDGQPFFYFLFIQHSKENWGSLIRGTPKDNWDYNFTILTIIVELVID